MANAVLAYLGESDVRLSIRLQGWQAPGWFQLWMVSATRLGTGILWAVAAAGALASGRLRVLGTLIAASAAANAALVVLKGRFRRSVPATCLPGRRSSPTRRTSPTTTSRSLPVTR